MDFGSWNWQELVVAVISTVLGWLTRHFTGPGLLKAKE